MPTAFWMIPPGLIIKALCKSFCKTNRQRQPPKSCKASKYASHAGIQTPKGRKQSIFALRSIAPHLGHYLCQKEEQSTAKRPCALRKGTCASSGPPLLNRRLEIVVKGLLHVGFDVPPVGIGYANEDHAPGLVVRKINALRRLGHKKENIGCSQESV
eukprot:1160811-Pelagomonas_calceolata.AAC.11